MVANPTMIDAYRAGVPGNGKPFPDGSKIARIEWKPKKNTESPSDQELFDQMTELYPHWVANQSWLMFGFPGA
jgi:hypothetical protein